jgi:hypothetical protein
MGGQCPNLTAVTGRMLVVVSSQIEVWMLRGVGGGLLVISTFGFANAFVLKNHGPGVVLGVIAGLLAFGAFALAHNVTKNG